MQRRISLYVLLAAVSVLAADDPLKPVHAISEDKIVVWRFFPRTPCSIHTGNPTCPEGRGVPAMVNGTCTDAAVCNDLNAAELVPKGKKIALHISLPRETIASVLAQAAQDGLNAQHRTAHAQSESASGKA